MEEHLPRIQFASFGTSHSAHSSPSSFCVRLKCCFYLRYIHELCEMHSSDTFAHPSRRFEDVEMKWWFFSFFSFKQMNEKSDPNSNIRFNRILMTKKTTNDQSMIWEMIIQPSIHPSIEPLAYLLWYDWTCRKQETKMGVLCLRMKMQETHLRIFPFNECCCLRNAWACEDEEEENSWRRISTERNLITHIRWR